MLKLLGDSTVLTLSEVEGSINMSNIEQKFQPIQKFFDQEPAFNFIKELQTKFANAEIYLVGGMVRDIILGRESKDYDFVVRNVELDKLQQFLSQLGRVDLVGKVFGVLKFMPKNWDKEAIDIALPRTEHAFLTGGYKDFDVRFDSQLPLENDLERRDFTINALAWDIKNQKLIDHFDGLKDMEAKIIKTVGAPSERLEEDYSRILRGLRFACELGFTIEKLTGQAILDLMPNINDQKDKNFIVPRETVAKELIKAFVANPKKAFELYEQTKAFDILIPEIMRMKGCIQPENFHSEGDVWTHTKLSLEKLSSREFTKKFGQEKPSSQLIFGLLFHDAGKPYTIKTPERDGVERIQFYDHDNTGALLALQICHRLKLSSLGAENKLLHVDCDNVSWLVKKHMLAMHAIVEEMKDTTIEKYFFNPQVPGDDLMKLIYADILATIPKNGKMDISHFEKLEARIAKLKKLGKTKKSLPKEILDGYEIMKKFDLKPGPKIGELKEALREEQLAGRVKTKEEAWGFLENLKKK